MNAQYCIRAYPGRMLPHQYVNFVKARWMRSYRHGNHFIKLCDSNSYFEAYSRYIDALLAKPETAVRIAALVDDEDTALGFSVIRRHILDYVLVHKDCRKQGIGRFLVPEWITTMTHITRTGMKLWPTKLPGVIFNPFA